MRVLTYILCIVLSSPAISLARQTRSSWLSQSSSQKDPKNAWKEFDSEEGRFSVLVPGTPEEIVSELDTRVGHLPQFAYLLETATALFLITYADLPYSQPGDPAQQSRMLDAGRDRMLTRDKNLKLVSEMNISPAGINGREWITEDQTTLSRSRAFLVNGRLYMLSFSMEKNRALKSISSAPGSKNVTDLFTTTAEKFLISFKVAETSSESLGEVDQLLRRVKEQGITVVSAIGPNDVAAPQSSAGILNGRAVRLVQPQYPALARRAHVSGQVSVQVVIDLEGNIAAAQVVDGHPLLRAAAIKAARESRFTPTQLNGKPVMVAGIIIYNFAAH